jgi:hypothetical protein
VVGSSHYDFNLKPVATLKNKVLPLVRTSPAFYSIFSLGKNYLNHPVRHFALLTPRFEGYAIRDFLYS